MRLVAKEKMLYLQIKNIIVLIENPRHPPKSLFSELFITATNTNTILKY